MKCMINHNNKCGLLHFPDISALAFEAKREDSNPSQPCRVNLVSIFLRTAVNLGN